MKKIGMFAVCLPLLAGGMAWASPSVAEACGGYRSEVSPEVSRANALEQGVRASFERQNRIFTGLTVLRQRAATEGSPELVFVRARFRTSQGSFTQRLVLTPSVPSSGFPSTWSVVPVLRGPVRAVRVG